MTVKELEKAVAGLAPDELAQFRAWYEKFDAELFDAKLERDAHNGKLDKLVTDSEAEFRTGKFREI